MRLETLRELEVALTALGAAIKVQSTANGKWRASLTMPGVFDGALQSIEIDIASAVSGVFTKALERGLRP